MARCWSQSLNFWFWLSIGLFQKARETSINTVNQPSHIWQHFDSKFAIISEPWHPFSNSDSIMNVETVRMQRYRRNDQTCKTSAVVAYSWLALASGVAVYHMPMQKVQSRGVSILVYFLSSGVILTQRDTTIRWCAQSWLRNRVQAFWCSAWTDVRERVALSEQFLDIEQALLISWFDNSASSGIQSAYTSSCFFSSSTSFLSLSYRGISFLLLVRGETVFRGKGPSLVDDLSSSRDSIRLLVPRLIPMASHWRCLWKPYLDFHHPRL